MEGPTDQLKARSGHDSERADCGGWMSGSCRAAGSQTPPLLAGIPANQATKTGFVSLMHLVVTPGSALEVTLPGMPRYVSVARRLVREALPACPRIDDLMAAATELITNAITHSASGQNGTFTVQVRTAPRWARLEVADEGPKKGPPSASNGWGLTIVKGVTDRAAAVIRPDGKRVAWCEVTWPA